MTSGHYVAYVKRQDPPLAKSGGGKGERAAGDADTGRQACRRRARADGTLASWACAHRAPSTPHTAHLDLDADETPLLLQTPVSRLQHTHQKGVGSRFRCLPHLPSH
jgi:hypothetical protein